MAESHIRAAQLADQIRDYLAAWTSRDYPGSFVVVTSVTLSTNLRTATAWFRTTDDPVKMYRTLRKATPHYQHLLLTHLGRFKIPRISFAIDTLSEEEPWATLPTQ